MPSPSPRQYVSRAGEKLAHALRELSVSVQGMRCADFGCNVGGFTDCLLQHGAAHVIAVDTGYGVLDWRLRNDRRVTVMERTNALHAPAPSAEQGGLTDLVTIDMAWTPQRLAIPAALKWLAPAGAGRVISLVKPHYEAAGLGEPLPRGGVLADDASLRVFERVLEQMPGWGVSVLGSTASPLTGGAKARGNTEFLVLLSRV